MKMPRLAVFADIHACLPALDMALAELERESIDDIIVAGDMLAGPTPVQVISRLRERNCAMIRGNQENYLLRYFGGTAPDYFYASQQWTFMRWNYEQLDRETLEFIASLPEQRVVDMPGCDPIRLVHGSPRNVSELIYPDRDMSLLDTALALVDEPVMVCGHTHLSWCMYRNGKLALNPGGLSGNFSGKPAGGYAILHWEDNAWQVELRELHYDFEAIRKSYYDGGLMDEAPAISRYWLLSTETGVNYLPLFVRLACDMANSAGYGNLEYVPDHIWERADELFLKKLPTLVNG